MSPINKIIAGWLTPIEITADGYYPVQPSEISSQVYKISKNYPEGEYVSTVSQRDHVQCSSKISNCVTFEIILAHPIYSAVTD